MAVSPKYTLPAPPQKHGMNPQDAYHNGYCRGYESIVTPWVCDLIHGTEERKAWMRGYREGEKDAGVEPYSSIVMPKDLPE
jgi:hypothetical protein